MNTSNPSGLNAPIFSKIAEIRQVLRTVDTSSSNISLMGGETGRALFFLSCYPLFLEEEDLEMAAEIIQDTTVKILSNPIYPYTFSSGLAGFGWLLAFVDREELMDLGADQILEQLDEHLGSFMLMQTARANFDYLHGAMGVGLYFLARKQSAKRDAYLVQLIKALAEAATWTDQHCKWTFFNPEEGLLKEGVYNLGLSHGIPSILMFLIKAHQQNIWPEKTKQLIEGAANFLVSAAHEIPQKGAYYPNEINVESKIVNSRLGWCYGDLGIAYSLLKSVEISKDQKVEEFAFKVLDHTLLRLDLHENYVYDAGFCHGAAGIAHIFHQLYLLTHQDRFKQGAAFWLQQTLQMAQHTDGLAGYKSFKNADGGVWHNDPSLLEGLAGIGLALMASPHNESQPWNEIFLL